MWMKKETIVPLVTFNQWHTFDTFFRLLWRIKAIHFAHKKGLLFGRGAEYIPSRSDWANKVVILSFSHSHWQTYRLFIHFLRGAIQKLDYYRRGLKKLGHCSRSPLCRKIPTPTTKKVGIIVLHTVTNYPILLTIIFWNDFFVIQ